MATSAMKTNLPQETYVAKDEFTTHKEETQKTFDKIFSSLEDHTKGLDIITEEMSTIKLKTAVIETRVDSILDSIDSMSENINKHFELIKEATLAREENSALKLENFIESTLDKKLEHLSSPAPTPKSEEKKPDEGKNEKATVISLILTGLTAVLVAGIQVLPSLLK